MSARMRLLTGALALVVAVAMASCSDDDGGVTPPDAQLTVATCEGCHTSETMLKATVLPDPPPPAESGEG